MEINFLWPRNVAVGAQNPPLSFLLSTGSNVTYTGPLSGFPLYELTLGVILLVGVIYYVIAQRNAPETKAVLPSEAAAS
jgi:hypothetical protein